VWEGRSREAFNVFLRAPCMRFCDGIQDFLGQPAPPKRPSCAVDPAGGGPSPARRPAPRVDGDLYTCHGRSMDDAEQKTAVAGRWITLPRVGAAVLVASVSFGLLAGLIVAIAGAGHWMWRARAREA
jgi:hypothetical protein